MRAELPGTVVFLFQPAEEGPPPGEKGGALMALAEGAFADPRPGAVFGIHVAPEPGGMLLTRAGPFYAGSDKLTITLTGRQTHGARPWNGVDHRLARRRGDPVAQPDRRAPPRRRAEPDGDHRRDHRRGHPPQHHPRAAGVMTGTVRTFTPERRSRVIDSSPAP
ncbi:MAG: M20/M25/M40 family metallo-hydrolase [Sphingomonas sp.]